MNAPLGCFTRPWEKFDFPTACKGIADAGYTLIGLMRQELKYTVTPDSTPAQVDEIKKVITDNGLKFVNLVSRVPVGSGTAEQEADGLKKLLDHVKRLGGVNVMVAGTAKETLYDHAYSVWTMAAKHADSVGLQLVLKPHGGMCGTGPLLAHCVERVGSPAFKVWYDCGNILFYNNKPPAPTLTPETDLPGVMRYVTGMCVKDCQLGTGAKGTNAVDIMPGEGLVKWAEIFHLLAMAKFNGPLLVECLGGKTLEEINERAKKTQQFLTKLIGAA